MKRVLLDFLQGVRLGMLSLIGFMFAILSVVSFCHIHTIENAWMAIILFFTAIASLAFCVATFVSIGTNIRELEESKPMNELKPEICFFCESHENVRYIYDLTSREKYPCCKKCELKFIEGERK